LKKYLADCKVGEKVCLKAIDETQLSIQLSSMGCFIGELIRVERIAPFGDPIVISVDNNFISLRKKDAQQMKVGKIEAI